MNAPPHFPEDMAKPVLGKFGSIELTANRLSTLAIEDLNQRW
jgi:hypothetical protein